MMVRSVLLLGGSGFVGSSVANQLAAQGIRVTLPTRRRERNKSSLVLPTVDVVEADIWAEGVLNHLLVGQDAVINLVGILHDRDSRLPYGRGFAAAHVDWPRRLLGAMQQLGVRRLVHVSALGADVQGPSEYLRSKGEGERVVLAAGSDCDVTVFRPSVIFGPGDRFLNVFAKVLRYLPVFAAGSLATRFQPVYVEDVAGAIVACLGPLRADVPGGCYTLCGPRVYSLRELVAYVAALMGVRRAIVNLPDGWAYLQAGLLWLLPHPLMSPDNLRSMTVDSVAPVDALFYPDWQPAALEAVVPSYLGPGVSQARLDRFRYFAGR